MFRVLCIDHLVLRVTSLPVMQAFYCGVLGCSVEREEPEQGITQQRAGSCLIDLVPIDGPLGMQGGAAPGVEGRNLDHFCLAIAPFDVVQLQLHLQACGVPAGAVVSRYGAGGRGPSIYMCPTRKATRSNSRARHTHPPADCFFSEGRIKGKWVPTGRCALLRLAKVVAGHSGCGRCRQLAVVARFNATAII